MIFLFYCHFSAQHYIEMGMSNKMFFKFLDIDKQNMKDEIKKVDNELQIEEGLQLEPLVLEHFEGPFGLLVGGLFLAFLVFGSELYYGKIIDKHR